MVWHGETDLPEGIDIVGVPGGFSYGDYLRSGAMAARSPVMRAVADAAARGVAVLGVCNGFQVLTETGLLPGALMRNAGLNFVCRDVDLTVANARRCLPPNMTTPRRSASRSRTMTAIISPTTPRSTGSRARAASPSAMRAGQRLGANIAGIVNDAGNVLGLMPHPERMIDAGAHGRADGRRLFEGLIEALG